MTQIQCFSGTDRGLVRSCNEDSVLVFTPEEKSILEGKGILAVVADGVGGGAAGGTASSMAVQIVRSSYYDDDAGDPLTALQRAFNRAHQAIQARSAEEPACRGMATTCTAVALIENDCYVAHLGDSRAYLLRRGILTRMTEDDTFVSKLVRDGFISPDDAQTHPQKNVILKAMGSRDGGKPFVARHALQDGDRVFLCSDGLHGLVPAEEITSLLTGFPLPDAGEKLIEAAKSHGGTDNISVAILYILPESENLEATKPLSPKPPDRARTTFRRALSLILTSAAILLLAAGAIFHYLRTMPTAKPW